MRGMIMHIAAVVGLASIAIAAPTNAEARFGVGLIPEAAGVQPAQYYGGYGYYYRRPYYGYYRPYYYAPRYYAPRYYRPRYYY